jgi:hypothetical protein
LLEVHDNLHTVFCWDAEKTDKEVTEIFLMATPGIADSNPTDCELDDRNSISGKDRDYPFPHPGRI